MEFNFVGNADELKTLLSHLPTGAEATSDKAHPIIVVSVFCS